MSENDVNRCRDVIIFHFSESKRYKDFDLERPIVNGEKVMFKLNEKSKLDLENLSDLGLAFQKEFKMNIISVSFSLSINSYSTHKYFIVNLGYKLYPFL